MIWQKLLATLKLFIDYKPKAFYKNDNSVESFAFEYQKKTFRWNKFESYLQLWPVDTVFVVYFNLSPPGSMWNNLLPAQASESSTILVPWVSIKNFHIF